MSADSRIATAQIDLYNRKWNVCFKKLTLGHGFFRRSFFILKLKKKKQTKKHVFQWRKITCENNKPYCMGIFHVTGFFTLNCKQKIKKVQVYIV